MNNKLRETVKRIIDRDILTCSSYLFSHLQDTSPTCLYDDIFNLYLTTDEILSIYEYDFKLWQKNNPELSTKKCIETFCEDIQDNGSDLKEPLQWFIVTKWLYDELNEQLEPVCEFEDVYFWGRCGCGYSLEDEYAIREIAKKLINYVEEV